MFMRGTVECDGACVSEAFYDDEDTWNGWLMPLFEYENIERILRECVDSEYSDVVDFEYDENTDCFVVEDSAVHQRIDFAGRDIEFEGEEYHVYQLFDGLWIWSEV